MAIWSTTWIAITFQLGTVAPEISVFYRFFLASALLFAWCALRRLPLRFDWRAHGWLALFGASSFGVSYIFVYRAEQFVVSGVVAVGYSASPLLALLGTRAFFGQPMARSVGAASVLGIAGIALVFYPELALLDAGTGTARGAIFTALAVLVSSAGGLLAYRNQRAQLPLWQTMAWGMLYGSLLSLAIGLASGKALVLEVTPAYVASLFYLSIFGSILAFAGYLTLLRTIGPARAGYIGVMVPVAALFISAAFEGFRFHALTWAGIALSLLGNVLVLRRHL